MGKMQIELDNTKLELVDVKNKFAAQRQECSAHGYKYFMMKQKCAAERRARIADQQKFLQQMAIKDGTINALQQSITQSQMGRPNYGQAAIMPNPFQQSLPLPSMPLLQNVSAPAIFPQSNIPNALFSKLKELDSDDSVELPANFRSGK